MKKKIFYCTIMYIVTYILIVGISVQDYNIFSTVVRNQTTETVRYTIIPWLWVSRLINWVPVLLACCMVYTMIKNVVVSESFLFAGVSICKMLIRLFPQADKTTIIIYLHISSVVIYLILTGKIEQRVSAWRSVRDAFAKKTVRRAVIIFAICGIICNLVYIFAPKKTFYAYIPEETRTTVVCEDLSSYYPYADLTIEHEYVIIGLAWNHKDFQGCVVKAEKPGTDVIRIKQSGDLKGNVEVEYPVTVDEKLRFHIKPSVSYLYHRYCANVNFCIGMILLLVAVWNSGDTITETKRRVKMACILLTLIIYGMCIGVEAVQIGVKYVALFILFSIYVLLDCFRLRSKKTNGILGAVLICLFLYSSYYVELLLWLWFAWQVFSYKNSQSSRC